MPRSRKIQKKDPPIARPREDSGSRRFQTSLGFLVEIAREWALLGDRHVRLEVADLRRTDDRARKAGVRKREAEHELQPGHIAEQLLDAGKLPAPLTPAFGEADR